MTTPNHPAASQQAAVEAALLILERMGLSPGGLTSAGSDRKPVPTFAKYVPVVSAAVTDGTRKAYGSEEESSSWVGPLQADMEGAWLGVGSVEAVRVRPLGAVTTSLGVLAALGPAGSPCATPCPP